MISVVIANFNSKELLQRCLDSIREQSFKDIEIIVVDNGSSDGSVEILRTFPDVKLIENIQNLLFCKAYNQGIVASRGRFILCLNNDVWLEKDYFCNVLSAIRQSETIGMVSAKVLREDKKTLDSTGLFLGRNRRAVERGFNRKDRGQYEKPGFVFGVTGACVFFRRAFLVDVRDEYGYFDERFGMYFEDLDLCWRGQKQGWKAYYEPKAVAYHTRSATTIGNKNGKRGMSILHLSDDLRKRYVRNRYLCIKKNDSLQGILINLPFILFYEVLQGLFLLFLKLIGHSNGLRESG